MEPSAASCAPREVNGAMGVVSSHIWYPSIRADSGRVAMEQLHGGTDLLLVTVSSAMTATGRFGLFFAVL